MRELVGAGEDDERFMVDETFHRAELPTEGPAAMAHWGSSEPSYFAGALGQRFSSGLRLVAALADAPAGAGGVVLVPCSHRAANSVPEKARSGEALRGLLVQPELKAGDLLVMASGLAHGLAPWTGAAEPNLIVGEFINVRARPRAGIVRSDWPQEEPWMADLSPEQRAVLGVPLSPTDEAEQSLLPPVLSDGKQVWLGDGAATDHHPALTGAGPAETTVDPVEAYQWDKDGFLIVPNALEEEWRIAALEAVEAQREPGGSVDDLLRPPHNEPFLHMLAHPAMIQRLNWMQGGGFHCGYAGRAICWDGGQGGQMLHGDVTTVSPTSPFHWYEYKDGRTGTGSINVAWQLLDVDEGDGGFVSAPDPSAFERRGCLTQDVAAAFR